MMPSEVFFQKCMDEVMKQHPEVFNTWMHLYGNKWMNTYSLEIKVIKTPGDLTRWLKGQI